MFLKHNLVITFALLGGYLILLFQQVLGHYSMNDADLKLRKFSKKASDMKNEAQINENYKSFTI